MRRRLAPDRDDAEAEEATGPDVADGQPRPRDAAGKSPHARTRVRRRIENRLAQGLETLTPSQPHGHNGRGPTRSDRRARQAKAVRRWSREAAVGLLALAALVLGHLAQLLAAAWRWARRHAPTVRRAATEAARATARAVRGGVGAVRTHGPPLARQGHRVMVTEVLPRLALTLAVLTLALATVTASAARVTRRAAVAGGRGGARAAVVTVRTARTYGPPAARRLREVALVEVGPRIARGLRRGWRIARAASVTAARATDTAARVTDRAILLAGLHTDRVLQATDDRLAVLMSVRAPAAWRAVRPPLVAVARGAGLTVGAVTTVAIVLAVLTGPTLSLLASSANVDSFDDLPPLAEPSVVRAADGTEVGRFNNSIDRRIVALADVPVHARDAVLSAEDRRFYDHNGYDAEAMARATVANVRAGEMVQGGSTLTQQLAKQNLVGTDRTVRRKASELVHAVALEEAFTKEELLERYLNQVYFGRGAYGIAAAAEAYFAKPIEEVSVEEAALLASLIRAPGAFEPAEQTEEATRRRDRVLQRMAADRRLSREDAHTAQQAPLQLAPPPDRSVADPHTLAAVRRDLLADPRLGNTPADRERLLQNGGLKITTTVDLELQERMREVVHARMGEGPGPAAAVAMIEPGTGRVQALYGGTDYATSQFSLATQARRQPGSTVKPLVAAAALEAGHDPGQLLDGGPRSQFDLGGGTWTVRNFGDMAHGPVNLETAVVRSVNTAFAQLAVEVGTDRIVDVFARSGIDVEGALGDPETHGPSLALGGFAHGVSPLELAGAYGVFAADGTYARPQLVEEVRDADGDVLAKFEADTSRALPPDVARQVADMLGQAVEQGTGEAAQIPDRTVAGKTGTSQHRADAWFVGTTDGLSAAVWLGHPEGSRPLPGGTGGSLAAPLWRDVVTTALTELEEE